MRVDEARRDDGAAEVDALVGLAARRPRRPRRSTPSSTSSQPDSCSVPASSHVTTQPPAKRRLHASSGTSSKRSTSTSPRSVIFRCGITESAEEREREERRRARPAERVRGVVARPALRDHVGERRIGEQPGDRERALREDAAVLDRDDAAADLGQPLDREGHVASRTCRRRRGCARRGRRDEASAPRCSPDPETKPSPIRPVARCRSTTAIFARSRSASATASPSSTAGSATSDSVTT